MEGEKPARGNTVLIVDDDPDVRETMADAVESMGRRALTAADGSDALSKLDTAPRPCVVLLDLHMRPMSGHEFIEKLQARPDAAQFPVVLMPASLPIPASARNASGVVGALTKPFSLEELGELLEEHCPLLPEG